MSFEVEQKFPVGDLTEVQRKLEQLGARVAEAVEQVDRYYRHPQRDFAVTDEALRIRRIGKQTRITYKGKKEDSQTKTRREIEFELPDFQQAAELLEALGFREVADVHKQRRVAALTWEDHEVEVALDDVEQVGTFVELELTAERDELDRARAILQSLAERLQLSGGERRSYLELLLDRRKQGQDPEQKAKG